MKLELIRCRGLAEAAGGRPPLLFVHGSFSGAWIWAEHFLPFFARAGFDCAAVSLRGHGGSEGIERLDQAGLADYVADAAVALDRLERTPVVIGHSMGGLVAQHLAERQAVAGLALLSSVPPSGLAASAMHMAQVAPDLLWQLAILQSLGPEAVDPGAVHRALFAPDTPVTVGLRYLPRLQRESRRINLDMMGWTRPSPPVPPPPVLVVGGDADMFLPVTAFQETAWHYGAELKVLPGVPHGLMLDPSWRTSAEVILEWLHRKFPV